jgi:hypothetical protein
VHFACLPCPPGGRVCGCHSNSFLAVLVWKMSQRQATRAHALRTGAAPDKLALRAPTQADYQKAATPFYIIDPRQSKWLPYWDVAAATALIFTASVTPFEVAYLPSPSPTWLLVVNRIVDVTFLVDIILNFFLAYPSDNRQTTMGAHWVQDHRTIVRHYCTGWFTVDILASATSLVDIVNVVLRPDEQTTARSKQLKMFRALRVLRLVKLVHLLRGMRLLQRWETQLRINYGMLSIAQSMIVVVVAAHWSACLWMLQIALRDHLEDTWVWNIGYCIDSGAWQATLQAQTSMDSDPASLKLVRDLSKYSPDWVPQGFTGAYTCLPPSSMFSVAFYWAIMTITSVGYGDVVATPRQPSEQIVAALLMLGGAFVWSQVIATFCGVLSTMYPASTQFRLTLEALNSYMSLHGLPDEMRQRLRDFFHRTRHLWHSAASHEALMKMSPKLQGEVLLHTNGKWIERVSWLRNEDPRFLVDVILALRPTVFAPDETIRTSALHIVLAGLAICGGRLIRHGAVWGDDMLLAAAHLRARTIVRAITYVEGASAGFNSGASLLTASFASSHSLRSCWLSICPSQ